MFRSATEVSRTCRKCDAHPPLYPSLESGGLCSCGEEMSSCIDFTLNPDVSRLNLDCVPRSSTSFSIEEFAAVYNLASSNGIEQDCVLCEIDERECVSAVCSCFSCF